MSFNVRGAVSATVAAASTRKQQARLDFIRIILRVSCCVREKLVDGLSGSYGYTVTDTAAMCLLGSSILSTGSAHATVAGTIEARTETAAA